MIMSVVLPRSGLYAIELSLAHALKFPLALRSVYAVSMLYVSHQQGCIDAPSHVQRYCIHERD
jgi:hypothetical protein